jgi:hypothetical protein
MITPEEFERYEKVRQSGVTNMFHTSLVQKLTDLTKEQVIEIMNNYSKLKRRYDVTRQHKNNP